MIQVFSRAAALPFFSLSWVLTLMSHDLTSFAVVSRLFDFLLAHNPAMISYLGVAVILLKKDELAMLDEDDAADPAMLHHTLSKVPNFVEDGYPFPATTNSSGTRSENQLGFSTEDLISAPGSNHSDSRGGRRPDSDSIMSSSIISLSEAPSTSEQGLSSSDVSRSSSTSSFKHLSLPAGMEPDFDTGLDDFSASVLSDPDVSGPAFSSPSITSRSSSHASVHEPTSPLQSASPETPTSPLSPPTSIEVLIQSALDLWVRHPLVGEGGIDADQVMGPKSCIFTWGLSEEGLLDDAAAEDIVRQAVDIVLPDARPPSYEDSLPGKESGKKPRRPEDDGALQRRLWMVGSAVGVVGVGVLLAAAWGKGGWLSGEWRRWLSWTGW